MVLVLADESLMDGLTAIVMISLVGPGASLALLLARQARTSQGEHESACQNGLVGLC